MTRCSEPRSVQERHDDRVAGIDTNTLGRASLIVPHTHAIPVLVVEALTNGQLHAGE
jgi:hypothetical protein